MQGEMRHNCKKSGCWIKKNNEISLLVPAFENTKIRFSDIDGFCGVYPITCNSNEKYNKISYLVLEFKNIKEKITQSIKDQLIGLSLNLKSYREDLPTYCLLIFTEKKENEMKIVGYYKIEKGKIYEYKKTNTESFISMVNDWLNRALK